MHSSGRKEYHDAAMKRNSSQKRRLLLPLRFFGGGFGGFGGFGGQEEEDATPKGNDVYADIEVTLKDLYLGHQFKVGAPGLTYAV